MKNIMNKIIAEVKAIRRENANNNRFQIDTIDILEGLRGYEVEYELKLEADISNCGVYSFKDFAEKYIDILFEYGFISEYYNADNSYNWNAPLSNNIQYYMYKDLLNDGEIYVLLNVHLVGDIRGNYTNSCVLHFDNECDFFEVLAKCDRFVDVVIDNIMYNVEVNIFSDVFTVYNDSYDEVCRICGYDEVDVINEIKSQVQ